jgi:hypothetical protein
MTLLHAIGAQNSTYWSVVDIFAGLAATILLALYFITGILHCFLVGYYLYQLLTLPTMHVCTKRQRCPMQTMIKAITLQLTRSQSKQQGNDSICERRSKRMVSKHAVWSQYTTTNNERRPLLSLSKLFYKGDLTCAWNYIYKK